jgi:hypothetical protein
LRTLLVNVNPFLAVFKEDWLLPVCEEEEVAAQFLTISKKVICHLNQNAPQMLVGPWMSICANSSVIERALFNKLAGTPKI